jgi:hypothetical protein
VSRPQTYQLIGLYISKPLEEQDAIEGTRFKTKTSEKQHRLEEEMILLGMINSDYFDRTPVWKKLVLDVIFSVF